MRNIVTHQSVNDCNKKIEIFVKDEPNAAGANNWYEIGWGDALENKTCINQVYLRFQDGDPNVVGVNGVTDEALLAVLIDRFENKKPSAENELAIVRLKSLMHMLATPSLGDVNAQ